MGLCKSRGVRGSAVRKWDGLSEALTQLYKAELLCWGVEEHDARPAAVGLRLESRDRPKSIAREPIPLDKAIYLEYTFNMI